jgi:hypothetical protein
VDLILKVLGFVAAGLAGAFISAAGNQTANEFRAWSPRVVDYLIKRAVSRLPEHMRDRLYEEWHRVIQDTPGQVGQIVQALDYLRGAVRIARDAPPVGVRIASRVGGFGTVSTRVQCHCYKCLRPIPQAAEKVRRKVYIGSGSRDVLFPEISVLNSILRRLLGLRTPHRSYMGIRVICLDCEATIRRKRTVVLLVILGVMLSLFASSGMEPSLLKMPPPTVRVLPVIGLL